MFTIPNSYKQKMQNLTFEEFKDEILRIENTRRNITSCATGGIMNGAMVYTIRYLKKLYPDYTKTLQITENEIETYIPEKSNKEISQQNRQGG